MKAVLNEESLFKIEELFVSTTDKKGIILSGNEVFTRISEYKLVELVNQPHNVIRHPDMPKTAFRLFWETISTGEPFCAYVKNRAKSGKYYWVFASTVPISTGYLSIRLKPSSKLQSTVETLYQQILKVEQDASASNVGLDLLLESLKTLGFDSYKEFMIHALFAELESRNEKIKDLKEEINQDRKSNDSFFSLIESIKKKCDLGLKDIVAGSTAFASIEGFHREFLKQSQTILNACRCLETLSLNMAVTANKLGKKGAALSLVSSAFQRSSREVLVRFSEFGKESHLLADEVQNAGLRFGLLRLAVEYLSRATADLLEKDPLKLTVEEKKRAINDQEVFTSMLKETLEKVFEEQDKAVRAVVEFKLYLLALKNMMVSFDLIRMGGRLEGSRNNETDQGFSAFINEIMAFLLSVEKPLQDMSIEIEKVLTVLVRMKEYLQVFTDTMIQVEMYQLRAQFNAKEPA